jgi:hypothetical protein
VSRLRQVALLAALIALYPTADWSWNGDVTAVAADTTEDLDGDGQPEWIQLTWLASDPSTDMRFDKVVIDVNGHLLADRGTAINCRIYIIDLVADDHRQEIAITEDGPSDDPATHIYAYALGSIRKLGTLPGHVSGPPRVDGSGKIETRCRGRILQTWYYPCTYSLNRYTLGFERVPEDYYAMDTPVTLKVDLPIVYDPEIQEVVGIIPAGSTARILGSDDVAWCEIESSNGLRGWFQVIALSRVAVVDGWKEASDVFNGLFIAD